MRQLGIARVYDNNNNNLKFLNRENWIKKRETVEKRSLSFTIELSHLSLGKVIASHNHDSNSAERSHRLLAYEPTTNSNSKKLGLLSQVGL